MATLNDYENNNGRERSNAYLPSSIRAFVGASDRVMTQDFQAFLPMYQGVEQLAVFNNRLAAEFACGFTKLNLETLRSGAAPRLLNILVSKTCGKVWYQGKGEEKKFNEKLDRNYFTDVLGKTFTETAQTGRSIMVLYNKTDEDLEISTYNLFRHRIRKDKLNNVLEAWIYLVKLNSDMSDYENVVCEHRFYKKTKDKATDKEVIKPYQEFLVYAIDYRNSTRKEAKTTVLEQVPEAIQNNYPNIKFNSAVELNLPSIGVYNIRQSSTNKKFLDSDVPEAMFVDALDTIVELETGITGKEVDKNIGRGQVLVPEFEQMPDSYMDLDLGGRMMRTVSTGATKDPMFKKYPSRSTEDSKPQNVQFDIRSADWISQIDNAEARLCACVGVSVLDYDPRLLQTGQRTDDEINAMTDITAQTVKDLRNRNEKEINHLLADVATYFKLNPVTIRWSLEAILNPSKNIALINQKLDSGLISKKAAVRQANPDLSEDEFEEMYKEIEAETKANPVTTPQAYENF